MHLKLLQKERFKKLLKQFFVSVIVSVIIKLVIQSQKSQKRHHRIVQKQLQIEKKMPRERYISLKKVRKLLII